MRKNLCRTALIAAALSMLAGCAPYGRVHEHVLSKLPPPPGLGMLADAEASIVAGLRQASRAPHKALAEYTRALKAASAQLARSPKDPAALRDYNFALGRIFTVIRKAKLDPWTQPMDLPGGAVLTCRRDPRPEYHPALYDLVPADEMECSGSYITQRHLKAGLGAPLVAVRKKVITAAEDKYAGTSRVYYGVTAVATFEGNRCVISFHEPLRQEEIAYGGQRYPLAADFTVSLAMLLHEERPDKMEASRLLNPDKYAHTARIARTEPYDPNKIPVLIVHGLMGSPATWVPMMNSLRADPFIRKHYQFWYFSYPSGYPIPKSLSVLHEQLDAIDRTYPSHKKIVLVGHSMGAVLSRLSISEAGTRVWDAMFSKPPGQLGLNAEDEAMLEKALIFHPRKDVSRAILIAGPHRGADMASSWLGRIGASLVRTPQHLTDLSGKMSHLLKADVAALKLDGAPNSVDTLAPNNRFVKAAADLPISKRIPYHVIIGDRAKGDSPNSSDGVVAYWSSHLPGAASEKIVPANHNAHRHEAGIEEVRRILRLHTEKAER